MELICVEEDGLRTVEGQPEQPFLENVEDARRVVEACLSAGAGAALLYAANLTPAFFDLSSGEAGAILQKLRQYHIRLAVVCPPGSVRLSSRFGDLLAEESKDRHFRLFETRQAARDWLAAIH
jgi:hypothetical protein